MSRSVPAIRGGSKLDPDAAIRGSERDLPQVHSEVEEFRNRSKDDLEEGAPKIKIIQPQSHVSTPLLSWVWDRVGDTYDREHNKGQLSTL